MTENLKSCFFFFTRQNVCTLKIRLPLFFPCTPDRHWACSLFRLEFSSNSFQIHLKFTSNYFQLYLQVHIFIFMRCLKVWECEKYDHIVLGYKRIHKRGGTFSGFFRIFMELCGFKVQLVPPQGNFISWRR